MYCIDFIKTKLSKFYFFLDSNEYIRKKEKQSYKVFTTVHYAQI